MTDSLKHVRKPEHVEYGATTVEDYDAGWDQWADMVKYSPAPYHRRRLIVDLAQRVRFASVIDIGCGTGELLRAVEQRFHPAVMAGTDLSPAVVKRNQEHMPAVSFHAHDLARGPLDRRWDLVLCSEVIEHIADYDAALRHLRAMCAGHLIVTVPSGRIFPIDLAMGHHQHFSPDEMAAALGRAGFEPVVTWQWGFPWHTAYKHLINLSPDASMRRFSAGAYSALDKWLARALAALFYANLKQRGTQLIVLARTT